MLNLIPTYSPSPKKGVANRIAQVAQQQLPTSRGQRQGVSARAAGACGADTEGTDGSSKMEHLQRLSFNQ